MPKPEEKSRRTYLPRGLDRVRLTLRIPVDLHERLKARADKAGRTLTAEIDRVLAESVSLTESMERHR